jgi:nitric oxide reductase NorE protein
MRTMQSPTIVPEREAPEARDVTLEDRHVPGEPGTWIFIFGDMLVFGVLFATYLYYRGEDAGLFNRSQEALDPAFGAVNTLLLLISSLLVVLAVRSVRHGLPTVAPRLIAGAFACGIGFSAMKIVEYSDKIGHDLTPATNDFFMYYFVLTGLHWFHLLLGLAVLTYLFALSRKRSLTPRQFAFYEGGACFWHMIDLLWIVLFPLLYLVH